MYSFCLFELIKSDILEEKNFSILLQHTYKNRRQFVCLSNYETTKMSMRFKKDIRYILF